MAGQSQTSPSRREQRETSERRQRLIVIAVVAALTAVAVVVAVGLYITQYQAPRAHVLTIDGRDYDTSAVARRGTYLALVEGGLRDQGTTPFAETVADLLINEAVLRAAGPSLVGPVGDAEVEDDLFESSGLTEKGGRDAFAGLLQTSIQNSGLPRDEFYEVIAASVLRTRLDEHFEGLVEPTARQVKLSRMRLSSGEEVDEVRQLYADGESFADLVLARTIDEANRGNGGELGWWVASGLIPEVVETIEGVEPGELAPVLATGIFFDLYLVTERDPERELTPDQITTDVRRQFIEWLEEGRGLVSSEIDISGGESDWIRDRIIADASRAVGG
ncbi:MAG TPA: peptidylprolyl isomerase [Dehalococcoidia bacterium]|nr:peptidylprolyl isomerase [Dehalococcoidia bacterium]